MTVFYALKLLYILSYRKLNREQSMFDRSVNKVVLIGSLGKDPEIRHTQAGLTVASLTLATTDSWKDKVSGERVENTEWHRLSVFNRLGEMCGQYLKKGNKIYIEGKLKTRKWQAQDSSDRYTTEIVVSQLEMLDSKSNNMDTPSAPVMHPTTNLAPKVAPVLPTYGTKPPEVNTNNTGSYASLDFDDDIPF